MPETDTILPMKAQTFDDKFQLRCAPFIQRMQADGAPAVLLDWFRHYYHKLVEQQHDLVPAAAIGEDVPVVEGANLSAPAGRGMLDRVVVIKLNGGLGTSMGLQQTKSLIPAKDGLSFLDILIRHILWMRKETRARVPLLLMDSYATHAASQAHVARYSDLLAGQSDLPCAICQHRVPRIRRDDLTPVTVPGQPDWEWAPPGHGDLYPLLHRTGLLRQLLASGFEYAFVANSDNLGATLDPAILDYVAREKIPFLMEVTDRTPMDKKGGHLCRTRDGRLLLREAAQCPPEDLADFQDITRHRFFNTNNLWVHLGRLAELLERAGGWLDLPLIVNAKTANPLEASSTPVLQLETAMGAAIGSFPGARALRVSRCRFLPIKTTNDLLALWSDAYVLNAEQNVVVNPRRQGPPIYIDLDPAYFRNFGEFKNRFLEGAPALVDCEQMSVAGDYYFEREVACVGRVSLRNQTRHPLLVPAGTVFKQR